MLYGPENNSVFAGVVINNLRNIEYEPASSTLAYKAVPVSEESTYRRAASIQAAALINHPYDRAWVNLSDSYGAFPRKKDVYVKVMRPALVSWEKYVASLSYQHTPQKFLDYLRLINSAGPNPFALWKAGEWTGELGNQHFIEGYWVDKDTGEASWDEKTATGTTIQRFAGYPISILNLFQEVVISDALGIAFTVLDITHSTDGELLELAYKSILNRIPHIQSIINEESFVSIIEQGGKKITIPASIPKAVQKSLIVLAQDAAVIIRQNIDKLAAQAIRTSAFQARGIHVDFTGPAMLDIHAGAGLSRISSAPLLWDSPPDTNGRPIKKTNLVVPIAAALAIGTVAALT